MYVLSLVVYSRGRGGSSGRGMQGLKARRKLETKRMEQREKGSSMHVCTVYIIHGLKIREPSGAREENSV